ncbi:uncharacterized protein LOC125837398 [Solanum verrucosum]|uniref:uncharacterized protein LOC125837398 n=1 Tax=Solanum verrucosum TaxID=315347 RepID=UPI0020D0009D|nr:uncharacterized protein LOC125837398 [Solanum verrucosum]
MAGSRVREFLRMNPREFFGSKVEEDPNGFIDEVYKVLAIMGVTSVEKVELAAYQLKDVAQIWYEQWKYARPVETGLIVWEVLKLVFLDRFFPRKLREAKVEEFINLKQSSMSDKEYAFKFSLFSMYAPYMEANLRDMMSRFLTGVSELVEEECRTEMLGMANTRANARRDEEGNMDQKVPHQVPHQAPRQALIDPMGENVTHVEFRSTMKLLAQALAMQANREVVALANPIREITASRMRELFRMNPQEFYGSKMGEDPNRFID